MHTTIRTAAGLAAATALLVTLSACATRQTSTGTAQPARRAASDQALPPSIADRDFLEQFASTFRFRLGTPGSIKPLPSGEGVLFLRSGPRSFVQDLYQWDASTGRERVILTADQILAGEEEQLTAEELARRERMRMASRGIASYELSKDGAQVLVPLNGRLFLVDRRSGSKREFVSDKGFPIDPRLSPDATMISCVREGELYVIDIASGVETKLTSGAGGTITNGLAEFVAQEEMDRREGYWWSPDASMLVYQQTDTAGVEVFHIADPVNPEKDPQQWPYPRAGKQNARVTLAVASVRNGSAGQVPIQWDRERFPYVARVNWPKNAPLTVLVQNREQTEQSLLEVDPLTGVTRDLLTERDNAWINLHGEPRWLADGGSFLWITDAGVDERLERRDRSGRVTRTLVEGLTNLSLLAFDETARVAYVNASDTPTELHVWRVAIDGGQPPVKLSDVPGAHSAEFAKDFSLWVHASTVAKGERQWTVRRPDGSAVGSLRSVAENPPFQENVELTTVRTSSGVELHAAILRPRNFQSGLKYPVILSVYTGPGLQYVTTSPRGALLDQWYADHGFVVVRIDNRGTPGRGRAFERAVKGNLIELAMRDQVEGLQALASRYPEIDAQRVGVYGWSFGGYFSAMAAMQRPDVFKAGVAGAPVCDWLDYDTHYTERFMGLPQNNAKGYEQSNVLSYCKDLQVPLLVIHGTADDNVYFMHSLKMTDALFRAGKHFEFLALPGFTHMVPDPVVTRSLYGRIADFFVQNLAAR